jgi:hypothetical protein
VRCFGASVVRLRAGLRRGRRLDGCLPERLTGASGRWIIRGPHEDQGERREVHADYGGPDAKPVFEDRQPTTIVDRFAATDVTAITATSEIGVGTDGAEHAQRRQVLTTRPPMDQPSGSKVAVKWRNAAGSSTIR